MLCRYALILSLAGLQILLIGLKSGYFLVFWLGVTFVVVPPAQCLRRWLEGRVVAYLWDSRVRPAQVRALPEEALGLAADLRSIKTSIIPDDVEKLSGADIGLMDLLTAAGWMRRWSSMDKERWQAHPDLSLFIARECERRDLDLLKPGPRLGPRSRPSSFAERSLA